MPPRAEHTNRLRVERQHLGWSQVEFSRQINEQAVRMGSRARVSQPDVSLIERGLVPSTDVLAVLGAVFGVTDETIREWLREPAEECA